MELIVTKSDLSRFQSLRETMEKSLATLLVISLKLPYAQCESFADSVFLEAPNLVEFDLWTDIPDGIVSVEVKTRPRTGGLKTLWIPSLSNLLTERPSLFKNFASLKAEYSCSQSEWRVVLTHCHLSLKHLSLELYGTNDDELLQPLQLPILEILKLYEDGGVFPCWMVVPSSLKL